MINISRKTGADLQSIFGVSLGLLSIAVAALTWVHLLSPMDRYAECSLDDKISSSETACSFESTDNLSRSDLKERIFILLGLSSVATLLITRSFEGAKRQEEKETITEIIAARQAADLFLSETSLKPWNITFRGAPFFEYFNEISKETSAIYYMIKQRPNSDGEDSRYNMTVSPSYDQGKLNLLHRDFIPLPDLDFNLLKSKQRNQKRVNIEMKDIQDFHEHGKDMKDKLKFLVIKYIITAR